MSHSVCYACLPSREEQRGDGKFTNNQTGDTTLARWMGSPRLEVHLGEAPDLIKAPGSVYCAVCLPPCFWNEWTALQRPSMAWLAMCSAPFTGAVVSGMNGKHLFVLPGYFSASLLLLQNMCWRVNLAGACVPLALPWFLLCLRERRLERLPRGSHQI